MNKIKWSPDPFIKEAEKAIDGLMDISVTTPGEMIDGLRRAARIIEARADILEDEVIE